MAREFAAEMGATWPTVVDRDQSIAKRLPRRWAGRSRTTSIVTASSAASRSARSRTRTSRPATRRSPGDGATGCRRARGRVVVSGVHKAYGGRPVLAGVYVLGRAAASCSRCSGRTERARPRPSNSSRAIGRPTTGDVRVLGLDPWRDGRRLRPRVGLMLQDGGIDPRTSPLELLRLYARFHARPAAPDALLDLVGLRAVASATRTGACPAGNASGSPSPSRSSAGPRCSSSTSRRRAWTRPRRRRPGSSSTASVAPARRSCSRPTTSPTWSGSRPASLFSITAGSSPWARPPSSTAGAVPRLHFRVAVPFVESVRLTLEARLRVTAGPTGAGGTLSEEGASGRYVLDGIAPTPELVATLATFCATQGCCSSNCVRPAPPWRSGTSSSSDPGADRRARARAGITGVTRAAADRRGPRPGDGRAAPAWRIVFALTLHELRLAARRGELLLATFVVPAAVLLFFGGLGVLPTGTTSSVDFVLPGTMALAVIAASLVALGIATGYERAYGVLKRLGGSPASRGMVVGGKTLATLVVEAVQAVLLIALASIVLGWRPGDAAKPGGRRGGPRPRDGRVRRAGAAAGGHAAGGGDAGADERAVPGLAARRRDRRPREPASSNHLPMPRGHCRARR